MDAPILRAIPEEGEPWDNPTEERLFLMLQDIEAGQGDFVIVERTDDPARQTFAQALRHDDGTYTVEYRERDAEHHYATNVPDLRTAWQLLVGWTFQLPDWADQTSWSKLDLDS